MLRSRELEMEIVWYTDGSKTKHGTGAGIHGIRPRANYKISLGKLTSVSSRGICNNLLPTREYNKKL